VPVMKVQPAILRKVNERRVLNSIRLNRTMSRADLQRELNMTMPTVSRIIDMLIEQDWVHQKGYGDSTIGRPPVMLEINPRFPVAIGIEMGREVVRLVIVNLLADIIYQETVPLESIPDAQDLVDFISRTIQQCKLHIDAVLGVGIAAPGAKDPHPETPKNLIIYEVYRRWHLDQIEVLLEEQLGISSWMENDANAAVLGELWFGAGKSVRHLAFIYLDEGLGAGVAVNGTLYHGENNCAAEFAHTIVDIHSELMCDCGRRGCLGSVSTMKAIRDAVQVARPNETYSLSITIDRAISGIEPEASIVSRTLDYLAIGIINLIQVMDPSMVVLGGGAFISNHYMLIETQKRLSTLMIPRQMQVVLTPYGYFAVAIGAAALVLQSVFDHTQLIDSPQ